MTTFLIAYAAGALLMAGWVGYRTDDPDRNFYALRRVIIIALFWPFVIAAGLGSALRDE